MTFLRSLLMELMKARSVERLDVDEAAFLSCFHMASVMKCVVV